MQKIQEMLIHSLGQEDPLEEELAGVQPWWIQGIRRGDGIGEGKLIYLEI